MKSDALFHLYYSGVSGYDMDFEWKDKNCNKYCSCCSRLKILNEPLSIVSNEKINSGLDMTIIGGELIPGVISNYLLSCLGECAGEHLHIGDVYLNGGGNLIRQDFSTYISKYEYVVLRGRKPSVFMGAEIPVHERLVVCRECGFKSRRERAPSYLWSSEYPEKEITCSEMGLVIHGGIYDKIKHLKLNLVRVERIDIEEL